MKQICAKLSKRPWRPYELSSVNSVPGIYAIGVKQPRGIKYLYAGRSKHAKTRLQQHKTKKTQAIRKKVAATFKQYVKDKRQKRKEANIFDTWRGILDTV